MIIRESKAEDLYEISFLGKGFIERSISSKFITFDQTNFHRALITYIQNNFAKVWVAVDGEEIAGAICLIYTPNTYNSDELLGDIYFIDVVPKYQKRGLAKDLMRTVEDWAKKHNIVALSMSLNQKEIADKICDSMSYTLFEHKIIKKVT